MINKLRKINDELIRKAVDTKEKKKYEIIKKIMNDDNCFFKMDIEYAYSILRDLGIEEEKIRGIYMCLIDPEEIK